MRYNVDMTLLLIITTILIATSLVIQLFPLKDLNEIIDDKRYSVSYVMIYLGTIISVVGQFLTRINDNFYQVTGNGITIFGCFVV